MDKSLALLIASNIFIFYIHGPSQPISFLLLNIIYILNELMNTIVEAVSLDSRDWQDYSIIINYYYLIYKLIYETYVLNLTCLF